ncbi:MAG TPA: hypothetical protein VFY71_08440 [Planctomycetota bacterium]|nr:hypothetical protein [Planctomycetota bacterium]
MHGHVFARTVAAAAALAPELDRQWQAVRDLVPGCRDVPVDVWIVSELAAAQSGANLSDAEAFAIRDPPRVVVLEHDDEQSHSLAHELVHVLTDDAWRRLPAFVEEGLADHVATRLAPSSSRMTDLISMLPRLPGIRLRLTGRVGQEELNCTLQFDDAPMDAASLRDVLAQTSTHSTTDYVDRAADYSAGFLIVSLIVEREGLGRLRALCDEAGSRGQPLVPPEALLDAAQLPPEPGAWAPIVASMFGDDDLHVVARRFAHIIAGALVAMRPASADELAAALSGGMVELGLGNARVRLDQVPAVLEALPAELARATERGAPAPGSAAGG